jgi:uncharacterized protein GlcG (DUF336 family)
LRRTLHAAVFLAACAAALLCVAQSASAQSLPTQAYVPPALGSDAAKAAIAACAMQKASIAVALVDRYGTVIYAEQDKSAADDAAATAKRKATTALSGQSSADYAKGQHSRPGGPGTAVQYPAIILAGGGLPIKIGEGKNAETIAAIGVSGSPSEQMDEDCARAGLMKISDKLASLPQRKYLPLPLAQEAADAAVKFCKSIGSGVAVIVADRSGKPKVWLDADEGRADNADVARRKAYTAVVRRENTAILADEMLKLPGGRATRLPDPDLIGASGGLPFVVDGDVIGAIGVSGGGRDPDCSQAGLDKIKDRLK